MATITVRKKLYLDGTLTKVKALGDGVYEGIVATGDIDRHGESIDIKGLDTKAYMSTNPIVIFGHNYNNAPDVIGKAISLKKSKDGNLVSRFQLFTDIADSTAVMVDKLIKKGVMALSIGFVPKEIEGDTYSKSEMVEFSVVPIPANAAAMITARQAGVVEDYVKSVEMIEQKGAVAEEIQEDADLEAKSQNLDAVRDIWWAFCDVYYDEATSVDQFTVLLQEVITLFAQVVAGTYVDPSPDDGVDEDEYPVAYSLHKGISPERIAELQELSAKKEAEKPKEDESKVDATVNASVDLKSIDSIDEFVAKLKQVTGVLEEHKRQLSPAGKNQPTARMRKIHLVEARTSAKQADRLVEAVLAELKNTN